MPVKQTEDMSINERQEYFIHIKDLPLLADKRNIRDFFHGLSVKEEGIMIRHNNAFVAFDMTIDIDLAMKRKKHTLLGTEVQLSVISRAELRRLLFRLARRKLDFSEADGVFKRSKLQTESVQRKKIRPTPVMRGKKRKIESSLIFCPKESDQPPPERNAETYAMEYEKEFSQCKKKKIHPIKLSDNADMDNFSVFHPVACYELSSMIEAA